jgi:hypothetical protein
MTENNITPPPELVQQWLKERTLLKSQPLAHHYLATRAAQWGADQELEACCEWVDESTEGPQGEHAAAHLRAARRPKPPSLKEQALNILDKFSSGEMVAADKMVDTIRRALEQLDD